MRGTAVVDSSAFGKLYASPVTLARFEQDAGSTSQSTVRLEGHAAVGVERLTAAVRITENEPETRRGGLVRSDAASA
jgi:hypothetical protein